MYFKSSFTNLFFCSYKQKDLFASKFIKLFLQHPYNFAHKNFVNNVKNFIQYFILYQYFDFLRDLGLTPFFQLSPRQISTQFQCLNRECIADRLTDSRTNFYIYKFRMDLCGQHGLNSRTTFKNSLAHGQLLINVMSYSSKQKKVLDLHYANEIACNDMFEINRFIILSLKPSHSRGHLKMVLNTHSITHDFIKRGKSIFINSDTQFRWSTFNTLSHRFKLCLLLSATFHFPLLFDQIQYKLRITSLILYVLKGPQRFYRS